MVPAAKTTWSASGNRQDHSVSMVAGDWLRP
jgi:hypothetical protein